jgi:peptidoglycan/xylan/chitin deacetylase (PgdA/CDA1 family)
LRDSIPADTTSFASSADTPGWPPARPTGKRHRLASLLNKAGTLSAVRAVRRWTSPGVPILGYHRIIDVPVEDEYPYDVELVSCGVAAFALQMRHLRDHWRPISLPYLMELVDAGKPPPPGAVVVTFDDGFSDCYENAFPVLHEMKIPATVFVTTEYIDRQSTIWYEQLSHAVLTSRHQRLWVDGPGELLLRSVRERREAVKKLLRWIKRVPNAARLQAVTQIQRQLEVDGAKLDPRSAPLTWAQITTMSEAGVDFGSHSVTHPVLSMVDDESLAFELRDSKLRIEQMVGKPAISFAYPDGSEDAFNAKVLAAVRDAGYRCALSYVSGVESPRTWNPFAMRRLNIDRFVDDDMFSATLAVPEIFSY